MLCIICKFPFSQIICQHGLYPHCYATDAGRRWAMGDSLNAKTQSGPCLAGIDWVVGGGTNFLSDIKTLVDNNFLKLNSNITELLLIRSKILRPSSLMVPMSPSAHNQAAKMNPTLSCQSHINHVTKTSFFHLCKSTSLQSSLSHHS